MSDELPLVVSRRVGEGLVIGDETTITVLSVKGERVQLRIVSPLDVSIYVDEESPEK